jgi:hypothetical protein
MASKASDVPGGPYRYEEGGVEKDAQVVVLRQICRGCYYCAEPGETIFNANTVDALIRKKILAVLDPAHEDDNATWSGVGMIFYLTDFGHEVQKLMSEKEEDKK